MMNQTSNKVIDRVTETKLIGMMEVWEHIHMFGGFIDFDDAWKRYRCHQAAAPNKQHFREDILDESMGLSVHIAQFETSIGQKVRIIIQKDGTSIDIGKLIEYLEEKKDASNEYL